MGIHPSTFYPSVGQVSSGHTCLAQQLLDLEPRAVHEVFGFLLARCGDVALAEDLTSETFMEPLCGSNGNRSTR